MMPLRRRRLLAAALAFAAAPVGAWAQGETGVQRRQPPPPIAPENELERAFVAALTDEAMRPEFRRLLLASQVALAVANTAPDAPPRELRFGALSTGVIFTSATRMNAVLGPTAPRRMMTGREALSLLRGKNVVINLMLTPMLTLEPDDVETYLESGAQD